MVRHCLGLVGSPVAAASQTHSGLAAPQLWRLDNQKVGHVEASPQQSFPLAACLPLFGSLIQRCFCIRQCSCHSCPVCTHGVQQIAHYDLQVVLHFARELLRQRPSWERPEFMAAWQDTLPEVKHRLHWLLACSLWHCSAADTWGSCRSAQ